jgi:colanic acid/amylovoran biosynthesis glycosyltransferase
MRNVLHLVRKNSQLKASFIFNQISFHSEFKPFVVYAEKSEKLNDGGFADFDLQKIKYLDLSPEINGFSGLNYKLFKKVPKQGIQKLEKFIEENNINILHFHYGTDCGIYKLLFKRTKIPSVVSFYGYDSSSFPGFFFGYGKTYLKNRVFKNVTAVLVMSADMKKDLVSAGCPEQKIIEHYYGTNTQLFRQEKSYGEKSKINILILASLVPKKGHLFLLQTIKVLKDSGVKSFNLRVVGTGEQEEILKKYVRENNLQGFVEFVGAIKYASDEIFAEFRNADIFVHPSVTAEDGDKEGIPGTVIEAMAAGLPVISTYHAGIPSILENNVTGLLVKENSISDLMLAIKRLMSESKLREKLGIAGQHFALTKLDLRVKEAELESIYSQIIKDK